MSYMRSIKILTILLVICCMKCFAQTSITHTIMRGETIESIAKKYNITVEDLKRANPALEKMHYVGMTLKIPTLQTSSPVTTTAETNVKERDVKSENPTSSVLPTSNSHPNEGMFSYGGKGNLISDLNFQFIFLADKFLDAFYEGFNLGMNPDIGYRYYLHNNVFVEGMLGYKGMFLSNKNGDSKASLHCISIPIHIGGLLPITEKFGIAPFLGPHLDIPVKKKIEIDGQSQKGEKGNVGITLDFGLDIKFSDWAIHGQYCLGLGSAISVSNNINAACIGVSYGF